MPKSVLVPVSDDFATMRKRSLVNGISYWAEKRGVDIAVRTISEIKAGEVRFENVAFCYRALTTLSQKHLLTLPREIPLVADIATPVKKGENPFEGRRLALRNAFGTSVGDWHPEQQVPMLPPPLWPFKEKRRRDVIVFDVKAFHAVETHLYVASLLASIAKVLPQVEQALGFPLKVYFTSFFDFNLYRKLLETVATEDFIVTTQKDLWPTVLERLIPPAEDHEDYLSILREARLLITEHGDIVDSDVAHALCCGVPTLTYKRDTFAQSTGFQCSALKAVSLLDPDMPGRLTLANTLRVREEWGSLHALAINEVPAWDVAAYEKTFLKSWDLIYDWATAGVVNKGMNDAMTKGGWNKGIRLEKESLSQAKAISHYGLNVAKIGSASATSIGLGRIFKRLMPKG